MKIINGLRLKTLTKGGDSLIEAIENMENRDLKVTPSKDDCLFVITDNTIIEAKEAEGIEKYLFKGKNGGTIVFSTEVNTKILSSNKFKNWVSQKYVTVKNKLTSLKKLDQLRKKHEIYAWTIGRYLRGVYTGSNGLTYDENSMSLNIVGADLKLLGEVAKDLCIIFNQDSVMLKDDNSGKIYFVKNED